MQCSGADRAVPFFLSGAAGKLFALYFPPLREPVTERGVLYFPPFAEEMNKARRMAVLQARKLANLGHSVLLIDLFGTGDSEGDFAEARWDIWRTDLIAAADWLSERGSKGLIFWGLRLGTLLAAELATTVIRWPVERLVLWQPVARGETFMTQFLRLRIAADISSKRSRSVTTQELRESLWRGAPLEIAGYTLAPEMLRAVDSLDIRKAASANCPADWFEIAMDDGRPVSAIGRHVLDTWRAAGMQVTPHVMAGEPFWSTLEITVVTELLERTSELLVRRAA